MIIKISFTQKFKNVDYRTRGEGVQYTMGKLFRVKFVSGRVWTAFKFEANCSRFNTF